MAEFEEEKKTPQTRPGLFKYVANENGKNYENVKLCRFNKVQVF